MRPGGVPRPNFAPQPGLLGVPPGQPGMQNQQQFQGASPKMMTHAQAAMAPPPPPPSPPPEHEALTRANSGTGAPKERSKSQGPAFGKRFMQLRKEYPSVEVP